MSARVPIVIQQARRKLAFLTATVAENMCRRLRAGEHLPVEHSVLKQTWGKGGRPELPAIGEGR